ncbi:NIPSNAP family protein [Pararhizobium sp. DWP3-4]|uniref:NIPSNAP family protein n=1 Tax=unclassified Pararhizobium TaxID=2643050 RepID=UPI003CF722B3
MMSSYLKLVGQEGLAIQQPILGDLIGYFVTEIGDLNHVVHLWRFQSYEDRSLRRRRLSENELWQSFTPRLSACIETMENRILTPTDFSPLQ